MKPKTRTGHSVELQMIVKNESGSLGRCLRSVREAVDRIVIGDTGSVDETVAIARTLGAEVVSVPWRDDFAAARNAVLAHGRCDWVLVLDADEMLDEGGIAAVKKAVRYPEIAAYDVVRWNYVSQTNSRSGDQGALPNPGILPEASRFPAYVASVNTRLFRRHPEVFFERPVHETVLHRVRALGRPVSRASFLIHHFGQAEDTPGQRHQKNAAYYRIGLEHLEKHPKDAISYFELGLTQLEHYKNPATALEFFLRASSLNAADGNALLFAGVCLLRLGKYEEAIRLLSLSRSYLPHSIVLQESLGDAYFHSAIYRQALTAYRAALEAGSASALVLAKCGVCEIWCGQREAGLRKLEESLEREPGFTELRDVVAAGTALAQILPAAFAHGNAAPGAC